MYVVWFLLIIFNLSLVISASQVIEYGIGFLAPTNITDKTLSFLGNELASVYKLAVEDVNAKAVSMKSPVRLSTNFQDLMKNEDFTACKAATNAFLSNTNVVGVVGGFSSQCSMQMQKEIFKSDSNLTQISYASTSSELSDKSEYPTLFRTSSSDECQAQAIADLIKNFRWKRIGIVGAEDVHSKELTNEVIKRIREYGITAAESVLIKQNDAEDMIDARLQKLKNAGTRINLLLAAGDDVMKIIKRAKAKKMIGEGWVWIGGDGVASTWFQADGEVSKSANGIVAVSPRIPEGANLLMLIMSWFTKTTNDYPGRLWKLSKPGIGPYDGQVYDAVFVYFHALHALVTKGIISKTSSISFVREKLFEQLKLFKDWSSGINSISGGKVYFDIDGNTFDVVGSFDIVNYYDGLMTSVGTWNETSTGLNLPGGKITWPGKTKKTPTDRGTPGKPLFKVGFIAPLHPSLGELSTYGKELVSAAKVSVDIINKDRNQNVELELMVMDEGVDGDRTCKLAAERFLRYNVVAVVGGYRSSCSIAVSKALASSKTPVISYASGATELSNKKLHPFFFRIVPSVSYEAKALAKLITKYGFKGVGTLSSGELAALETAMIFEKLMANNSIPVRVSERFPFDSNAEILRPIIHKTSKSGSHVNLVSSLGHESAAIMQQLKEAKIAGKGWVWLGNSGMTSELLINNNELAKSMEGFLGVGPSAGEGSIYLNFLSSWLENDPLKCPGIVHSLVNPTSSPYTAQVYDAVNGVAISLSDLITTKVIAQQSSQTFIKEKLYDRLRRFSDLAKGYPSASGVKSVYFDANQDGPPSLDVLNFMDSKWKVIGGYKGVSDKLSFTQDPIFPGGTTAPVVGAGKIMYNVAAFFPRHPKLGPLAELGRHWANALRATVDWINKNQSIAIGFKLLALDSGFDGASCGATAQNLPDDVDLVIGEFRSSCTSSIYRQMQKRHIPIISYGSTASVFSNKIIYPYLFRTCPSNHHQSKALAEVVEKLKWDKLGIISTNDVYGSELSKALKDELDADNVEITAKEEFTPSRAERITKQLLKLKRSGTGVNLVISQPSDVLKVYQEAFEQGMTGKGWTWLGSDGAVSLTFSKSQHLQHAMQGMVGFRPKSGEGSIYSKILSKWKQRDENEQIPYAAQVIDSLLAPSAALHTLHTQNLITERVSKKDARFLLIRKLQQMRDATSGFQSATGAVSYFDDNQDSPGYYDMMNLNGNSWIAVGFYDSSGLQITRKIIWSGGTINTPPSNQPLDENAPPTPVDKPKKSDAALLAVAVIFGLFGALILCFMAYIIHRVRYRHLYMQSDVASGGLFSVLYGHRRDGQGYVRPDVQVMTHTNGHVKRDTEVTITRSS